MWLSLFLKEKVTFLICTHDEKFDKYINYPYTQVTSRLPFGFVEWEHISTLSVFRVHAIHWSVPSFLVLVIFHHCDDIRGIDHYKNEMFYLMNLPPLAFRPVINPSTAGSMDHKYAHLLALREQRKRQGWGPRVLLTRCHPLKISQDYCDLLEVIQVNST